MASLDRRRTSSAPVLVAIVLSLCAPAFARAQAPFVQSLDAAWAYPGMPVELRGAGFGVTAGASFVAIDGIAQPGAATFWSDDRVIFRLPYLPEQASGAIQVVRDGVLWSNAVPLAFAFPTRVEFTTPAPGAVVSELPLVLNVAPESGHGPVTSVTFEYRVWPDPAWHLFATDTDGSGPHQGTTTWIGSGDGWSASLPPPVASGPLEIRATAVDAFGQVMTGTALYVHDPTPLAPRLLGDGAALAASAFDGDELEGDVELSDEEIEQLLLVLFPVNWHHQRTLTHADQDTMDITDAQGNDISGNACGPVAAAVCLKWFGSRFPTLARQVDSLAREIARDAKTGSKGTNDDDLTAAIRAALKRAGLDPGTWKVTRETDPKKIWRSVIEGLNRDGCDEILTVNQQAATDVNGDGKLDSLDVLGHFVTVSSRGTRYRDYSGDGPPPFHAMGVEDYVDFMNPATGETEEYRVDTSKKPPRIVGYDLPGAAEGTPEDPKDPKISSAIRVEPPPPPGPHHALTIVPGLVIATLPVAGPGVVHFALPASGLPPGPGLLTFVGRDHFGAEAAEPGHMMVITNFCDVGDQPSVTTGAAPLSVTFANTSAPTDSVQSWAWDLDGDGIVDSTDPAPTWLYTVPGDYDVTLSAFNAHGVDVHTAPAQIHVTGTASAGDPGTRVTELRECRPNPFRTSTRVRFGLAKAGRASLVVFGVDGRRVRTLANGALPAGEHERSWDGSDERGRSAPSGLYFLRLETGAERHWARVARVR